MTRIGLPTRFGAVSLLGQVHNGHSPDVALVLLTLLLLAGGGVGSNQTGYGGRGLSPLVGWRLGIRFEFGAVLSHALKKSTL